MIENFDDKSNKNATTAYPTREEIESIIKEVFDSKSKLFSQSIQEKIINKLATNAVSFLIGIIVAGFVIFKVLDNSITTTNENMHLNGEIERLKTEKTELKTQIENLQLDIQKLKSSSISK